MITEINEQVKVKAVFSRGDVKILAILWNDRLMPVDEITYRWYTRQGIYPVYHFAVSSNKTVMELCFNPVKLLWRLDKIHDEL